MLSGIIIKDVSISSIYRYSTITTDVLTSIKKTEDSLLRLKRTRKPAGGQGTQAGPGSGVDGAGTITDDDKIRLQFALDVTDFGKIVSYEDFLNCY